MCRNEVELNGWTSVPVNAGAIFQDQPFITAPGPLSIDEIKFPSDDPVVAKTQEYAQAVLHPQTYNHSMRVYYYGMAIAKQQFPKQAATFSPATWALLCLLHDLGTAEENLTATRMSFDLYGGIKALQVLKDFGSTTDQAEAVAEGIIRHQDMGVDGTITFFGQLIQLATLYDNVGEHPYVKDFSKVLHDVTREEVNKAHPRQAWCSFFADTIRKEESVKPWCHSTHIVNFDRQIEGNTLMKQWE
ncbi:putative cyanamide hydratase [Aspergillus homomorphus CBS 101889]|uniref:Cyanamide hydratase n=1 Tax=Aspergillus homomorphus (strain CBS 101889) TaxID=1450537 RepID=A0A395HIA9_ASPHC|nr:cyanamide hydratase [Aspergillus homomorphus CBS 101889]RAL06905.1 cyanamide hydratase [Aspergillus homomorphus CBS 101889]